MPWLDLGICALMLATLAGLLYRRRERRTRALEEAYRGTLDLMSRLIDSAAAHSGNHSRRVAESSVEMAQALGLSATEVEDVRVAALLHDIGGLDVPAEALGKAAGLTPEEWDDVAGLALQGGRAVPAVGGTLRHALPMVTCLQERWDGTGQRALEGREIPLGARIIAVADAYDAMVTDRAYRKGRTHEEALGLLRDSSGSQFDPVVVEVFLQLHGALQANAAGKAA
jgi:HD-GYP domain-containing protein (c-di-GMP phosphodiesterase class II)